MILIQKKIWSISEKDMLFFMKKSGIFALLDIFLRKAYTAIGHKTDIDP